MAKRLSKTLGLLFVAILLTALSTSQAQAQTVPTCNGLPADYVGTSGPDYIVANRKPGMSLNRIIVVVGGAGNDTIYGADLTSAYICGNEGDDTIIGRNGHYTIFGGQGNDTITGGPNPDYIEGNLGKDTINGNGGGDVIYGNEEDDTLRGSCDGAFIGNCIGAPDTIYGGQGNDKIYGGAGNDRLYGNLGNNYIDGGGSGNSASPDSDDCFSATTTINCERVYP